VPDPYLVRFPGRVCSRRLRTAWLTCAGLTSGGSTSNGLMEFAQQWHCKLRAPGLLYLRSTLSITLIHRCSLPALLHGSYLFLQSTCCYSCPIIFFSSMLCQPWFVREIQRLWQWFLRIYDIYSRLQANTVEYGQLRSTT
jgi:hypothetical protein